MTQTQLNIGDIIPRRTARVTALIVGTAFAGTLACQRGSPRTDSREAVSPSKTWLATFEETGKVDVSPTVSGNLIAQYYATGSLVTKGQLLFDLDPIPFTAALDEARGRLSKTQSELRKASGVLRLARERLDAAVARHQRGGLDDYAHEQAQYLPQDDPGKDDTDEVTGKAEVVRRIAEVERAETQVVEAITAVRSFQVIVLKAATSLVLTHITSPSNGIAAGPQIQIGNVVGPGAGSIATISVLDPIRVAFTVSGRDFANLAQPDAYPTNLDFVLADRSTHSLKGSLSFAFPHAADPKSGDVEISAMFPNPSYRWRPGQRALVRIVREVGGGPGGR